MSILRRHLRKIKNNILPQPALRNNLNLNNLNLSRLPFFQLILFNITLEIIKILPNNCFLYVYKDSSCLSMDNIFDRLIRKFYYVLFVFVGRRSLSMSVIMQLCCLVRAWVWVSFGTFDCYIWCFYLLYPLMMSLKSNYFYIPFTVWYL